ncbi:hypothetical protein JCM8097_001227, partial [Rhodosporidiobolus ruineniae]
MPRSKKATKAAATPSTASDNATSSSAPDQPAKSSSSDRVLHGDAIDFAKLEKSKTTTKTGAFDGYTHPKARPDLQRPPPEANGLRALMVEFICIYCMVPFIRRVNDSGLGNLTKHTTLCKKKHDKETHARTLNDHGFVPVEAGATEVLQQWTVELAVCARPLTTVEDEPLQPLLSSTVRNRKPSRKEIAAAVDDLARFSRHEMIIELEHAIGGVYLSVDVWTTPNGWSLMGIVIHYRRRGKEGKIESVTQPLNFVPLSESHTGAYMADVLVKTVQFYKIEKKLIGIVGDSASNNLKMMDEIGSFHRFEGRTTFVRCILHIINLISKAILRSFSLAAKKKKTSGSGGKKKSSSTAAALENEEPEDLDPEYDLTPEEEQARLDDILSDKRGVDTLSDSAMSLLEKDLAKLQEEMDADDVAQSLAHSFRKDGEGDKVKLRDVCRAICKIQLIAIKLRYNKTVQALFEAECKEVGVAGNWTIPRSVKTRWNSEYVQMEAGHRLRKPIKRWQKNRDVKWDARNRLTDNEFDIFQSLSTILKPMYEFTLKFSKSGSPFIADALPVFDSFTYLLDKRLYDLTTFAVIHNSLVFGYRMTQRYYSLTDEVLHPSLSYAYMKAANWPELWIKTALELTQEYYMKWYGRSAAEEEEETDLVIVEPEEADEFISPAQRILLTAAAASAPPSTSLSDLIERTARTPPQYDHVKG